MSERSVSHLLRRGSVYTVATAVQLSVVVLVLPVVTRVLPTREFGAVTAALVVVQVLGFVASMGLPVAIELEWFDDEGGPPAARSLLLLNLGIAVVVAGVADLTGPVWADAAFGDVGYGTPLRCAVWSTVPFATMIAGQAILRVSDRATQFVVVAAIGTVGAQGLGLVAVLVAGRTATAYMVGYLIAATVAGATALLLAGLDVRRLGDVALLRRAGALALPTVPHSLAMYLLAAGDRLVVLRHLGLTDVARYQVAYLVGALTMTIAGAVNNAWSPMVFGATKEERWPTLRVTEAALVRLGGWLVAGLALSAPLVLALFAPASYGRAELVPVVAAVALAGLAYVDYLASGHVVFIERKAWLFAVLTPTVAGLNVVLNLVLVPWLGLVGSALATLVAYGVLASVAYAARRRLIGSWRDRRAFAVGRVVGLLGAGAGAALPGTTWGVAARALLLGVVAAGALREVRRAIARPAVGAEADADLTRDGVTLRSVAG